jgi:hypothetical protein
MVLKRTTWKRMKIDVRLPNVRSIFRYFHFSLSKGALRQAWMKR